LRPLFPPPIIFPTGEIPLSPPLPTQRLTGQSSLINFPGDRRSSFLSYLVRPFFPCWLKLRFPLPLFENILLTGPPLRNDPCRFLAAIPPFQLFDFSPALNIFYRFAFPFSPSSLPSEVRIYVRTVGLVSASVPLSCSLPHPGRLIRSFRSFFSAGSPTFYLSARQLRLQQRATIFPLKRLFPPPSPSSSPRPSSMNLFSPPLFIPTAIVCLDLKILQTFP